MNRKQFYINSVVVVGVTTLVVMMWYIFTPLNITTTGNYGLFIDNQDNNYFSTSDLNVRNIVKTHLAKGEDYPYEITDAERYGHKLVFYYTKDVFVVAEKNSWDAPVVAFAMNSMKTGEKISVCSIFAEAGLYKSEDILVSASFLNNGDTQGVCLYERGEANFAFINLDAELSPTETFFNDPTGQRLSAGIKNVDINKNTLLLDVYDRSRVGRDGNYAHNRILKVIY